jgi:hypothetical protein
VCQANFLLDTEANIFICHGSGYKGANMLGGVVGVTFELLLYFSGNETQRSFKRKRKGSEIVILGKGLGNRKEKSQVSQGSLSLVAIHTKQNPSTSCHYLNLNLVILPVWLWA